VSEEIYKKINDIDKHLTVIMIFDACRKNDISCLIDTPNLVKKEYFILYSSASTEYSYDGGNDYSLFTRSLVKYLPLKIDENFKELSFDDIVTLTMLDYKKFNQKTQNKTISTTSSIFI
jgi:hypothetical protein